jgi:DNA primase
VVIGSVSAVPDWAALLGQLRDQTVAVVREIERRAPDLATSKWWKEERHGVFVDFDQNAKDRTVASGHPPVAGCSRIRAADLGRGPPV